MTPKYVDVHCHPNLAGLKENQDQVIQKMAEEAVVGIVVGTTLQSSREAVALAEKHAHLYATVGLHPNYTQQEEFDRGAFSELLKHKKVVGVGECGIDYFRQSTTKQGEESGDGWKEKQWDVFKHHVALALEHDKPLMVHCRPSKGSMDAYEELADYLDSTVRSLGFAQEGEQERVRGNMHFFVGDLAVAKRFWALGFTTSFTGVLTFTHDYDEVVRDAPLDMILTETDAPWAAPVPHRGEINHPVYVRHVLDAVANIKGISAEEAGEAVWATAQRVFGVEIEPRIA